MGRDAGFFNDVRKTNRFLVLEAVHGQPAQLHCRRISIVLHGYLFSTAPVFFNFEQCVPTAASSPVVTMTSCRPSSAVSSIITAAHSSVGETGRQNSTFMPSSLKELLTAKTGRRSLLP